MYNARTGFKLPSSTNKIYSFKPNASKKQQSQSHIVYLYDSTSNEELHILKSGFVEFKKKSWWENY